MISNLYVPVKAFIINSSLLCIFLRHIHYIDEKLQFFLYFLIRIGIFWAKKNKERKKKAKENKYVKLQIGDA